MFSPSPAFSQSPPRPRAGLRRGGPVLLREVLPDALDQALSGRALPAGPPAAGQAERAERPAAPRWPPLPHAA